MGVVVHACNPSIWELGWTDHCGVEVSSGYKNLVYGDSLDFKVLSMKT